MYRTVLEQQIRARRQTLEEFAEYVEVFARKHGESGTLSLRHLHRLVTGHGPKGQPLGPVLPATARLLERIFGMSVEELLGPVPEYGLVGDGTDARHPNLLRVAIAVVRKGDDVLVVNRRERKPFWQFPAGMIKPGVRPELVAIRETLGETNVLCAARETLGGRMHPETNVFCYYVLCDYVGGDAANVDDFENIAVRWVGVRELPGLIPKDSIYRPVLDALDIALGEPVG
jgi:8-oxo-dGTP pyrophosphatase MutT (NUDIX family)